MRSAKEMVFASFPSFAGMHHVISHHIGRTYPTHA